MDRAKVIDCFEVARQAPSACNRQAFRFQYYDEPSQVQDVLQLGPGSRGIWIPAVALLVGLYDGYFDARDIKCPLIDASLAAMAFMYALETTGLSSLAINVPELPWVRKLAVRHCGLSDHECAVMLIGIGYADERGGIAISEKRPTRDLLLFGNPSRRA